MQKYILVAEDDDGIIQVVKLILESEGYSIKVARNEKEVRNLIGKRKPTVLLLDVSLGGSDGGILAKDIKMSEETKDIPVIIASANTETKSIAEKSQADGFLLKPFDIDTLLQTVKKYN